MSFLSCVCIIISIITQSRRLFILGTLWSKGNKNSSVSIYRHISIAEKFNIVIDRKVSSKNTYCVRIQFCAENAMDI